MRKNNPKRQKKQKSKKTLKLAFELKKSILLEMVSLFTLYKKNNPLATFLTCWYNKDMKKKFFLILSFLIFLTFPLSLSADWQKERVLSHTERSQLIQQLVQQIEILKWEIQLLQSLLLNSRLQQEITAQAYVAVDLSDNSIILQRNQNLSYPMASITKLMTAIIAFEKIDLDQKIILTEEMLKPLGHSLSLYLGLEVSAENLIRASLIQSSNDAAEALSYFLGKENFLTLMNQKAKELGMVNTFFHDSHGLSAANRSTSMDIVKLLSYIYENHPEILEITKNNDFWLPDSTGRMLKFMNMNNFYPIPSFIGGKTGYLIAARQTMASLFNVDGRPVAIVLLYSTNRQADIFNILRQIRN